MKRQLIVRFRNQCDLNKIGCKLGLNLVKLTKEINIPSMEIKFKKEENKKSVTRKYWQEEWIDMPEFDINSNTEEYSKIIFYFEDRNNTYISDLFEQKITDKTKSIWYPKLIPGLHRNIRVVGGRNPKYPIYVISKGRDWLGKSHTSFRLSQMNVKHYLVVEPQEYDLYYKNFNNEYVEIIKMDMSYKDSYDSFSDLGNINSTGAGAVRNFCWDHSINNGFDWHWVMDDNLEGFDRFFKKKRIMSMTGETFRTCEEFVDRYENIAISGLNYSKFCVDGEERPAFILNTRIYSCLLIRNNINYRWRGRYNEDTDLSLRVLKDGWCTVQFNLFLCAKRTTQQKKGGNTEEFYAKEGTIPKSQMLVDMHPDVVKMVWKFNRWHHVVDYSGFVQKLKLKSGIIRENKNNENGMYLIKIPREELNNEIDNKKYLEENYNNDKYIVTNIIYT